MSEEVAEDVEAGKGASTSNFFNLDAIEPAENNSKDLLSLTKFLTKDQEVESDLLEEVQAKVLRAVREKTIRTMASQIDEREKAMACVHWLKSIFLL